MSVALVLGGGGARCLAHIGVLQALEERGVKVAALSACSTGAFIGALIAAGHSSASVREVFDVGLLELLRVSEDAGLLDQDAIAEHLAPYVPATFAELALPFATVATDIQSGERVTLASGPLIPALCASNALPGLFDPVELAGRQLVDGGILDMVPVDLVKTLRQEKVVAVDVSLPKDQPVDLSRGDGLLERARYALSGQLTLPFELLRKAYVISQSFITELRLAQTPPDVLISPTFPASVGVFSFGELEAIVALGYEAAQRALGDEFRIP